MRKFREIFFFLSPSFYGMLCYTKQCHVVYNFMLHLVLFCDYSFGCKHKAVFGRFKSCIDYLDGIFSFSSHQNLSSTQL